MTAGDETERAAQTALHAALEILDPPLEALPACGGVCVDCVYCSCMLARGAVHAALVVVGRSINSIEASHARDVKRRLKS